MTESLENYKKPNVINLINRVEKKKRIYIKKKREIQKPPNQKPSSQ
jgi:hypothetical protein